MHIKTARTVIRDFRACDLQDLYLILGDGETMKYVEAPYSIEKTERFLNDFCIGQNGALAVEEKLTGNVIGYLLFKPHGSPDVYEIGWIFNRGYWRRGFAYETCDALIKYAFYSLGVRKIFAETVDTVRSAGLMRKLGMSPDTDHTELTPYGKLYFYSITAPADR